jgi:glycosyltransferase involved in cell wall biosynthesis
MADVLFVHNNFPAQFGFIAEALKARGLRCAVVGSESAKSADFPVRRWGLKRGTTPNIFPLAIRAEADLMRGRAAAESAMALRKQGFDPELIIGHPGWGETLLLRDVFPRARTILHGEFFYRPTGADVGFNRNFEPLRGFHVFMRALPRLLAEVPEAEVVLIGSAGRGYGGEVDKGSWKEMMLAEVGPRLDLGRVHFVGRVPYDRMLAALSVSAAHVYYTYPFVLSWSLLDAMASECLIVASDTAPVRDVIRGGENGLMLDFFDPEALSAALIRACREPEAFAPLRKAARETVVTHYDRKRVCLPAWLELIDQVRAR